VTEAWRLADLHAYVDDCLEPGERRAFEAQMAEHPALAQRATIWRDQSNAIRSAFDVDGGRAFSLNAGRQTNEFVDKRRRPAPVSMRLPRDLDAPAGPSAASALRLVRPTRSPRGFRPPLGRWLAFAGLSLCLVCLWPRAEPVAAGARLGEAGVAAFVAFASSTGSLGEFVTRDLVALEKQFGSRLSRPIYLPRSPPAVRMVDARIAPAPGAAAVFLVYETQRSRIGLLIQPLDAPPTQAPAVCLTDGRYIATWTRSGQGFVLVGEMDAASLLTIATEFFEAPVEPAQSMPERGS
jgi:anti-sigma factor RsiW